MRSLNSGYRVGKNVGGEQCEALEREIEAYYDVPHARVFNSGTSALHAAIASLGIGPGHEVIVPGYSMSASATCILHAGAKPVFADITDSYTLDWDDVARKTTAATRAIVLVHLFGHHATVPDGIHLPIVHDCAQSPTAHPGDYAKFASRSCDVWVYSLNQWKIVQSGEGGYALTYGTRLADRLHAVRNHGECTTDDILGWNYRMTEPVAAIARREFAELDTRIAARRLWAERFSEQYRFSDQGNIDWFLYPVRVANGDREDVARHLGGRVGYHKPIYQLPWFQKHGYSDVRLPRVERIESELVVVDPLKDDS